ncbi:dTDP-4-dehydrorhamnose 3,5-epimerase [Azonexus hydrophilus]|jgi:dTDP-4-dehydrorhamnose 3,5-epimerase|uniref:dTDP-4-dehydrorhamnose 3,5-epimerase n=1 Tax=Azonexus hydrophilus TaxID=418702 RepID=A0ABZ2XFT5_9RHOO
MNIQPTPIPGLMLVETSPHEDARGVFTRLYCERTLAHLIGQRKIVQVNHSCTFLTGAIRGLHFQYPPHAEIKLVRCLKGRIWDVAVDLRRDSATFLCWHATELSPSNSRMMLIPEGFAHGFQVLEPNSELLYLHTASYTPDAEGGLRYDDPKLGISWPLNVTDLSARDAKHPLIDRNFRGLSQ